MQSVYYDKLAVGAKCGALLVYQELYTIVFKIWAGDREGRQDKVFDLIREELPSINSEHSSQVQFIFINHHKASSEVRKKIIPMKLPFLVVPMFSMMMLSCTPAAVPATFKAVTDTEKTVACMEVSIDRGTPTFAGVALECGMSVVQDVVDWVAVALLAYQRKPDAGLAFVPMTHMHAALLSLHN